MINKIAKITLYVNDQEQAKKFWTEQVGFGLKYEQTMGPNMKWIEVGPSDEEFTTFVLYDKQLMQSQNPNCNVEHPSIILSTDRIEETHSFLKERDVQVGELMRMPYGTMFEFNDLDGNRYLVREN